MKLKTKKLFMTILGCFILPFTCFLMTTNAAPLQARTNTGGTPLEGHHYPQLYFKTYEAQYEDGTKQNLMEPAIINDDLGFTSCIIVNGAACGGEYITIYGKLQDWAIGTAKISDVVLKRVPVSGGQETSTPLTEGKDYTFDEGTGELTFRFEVTDTENAMFEFNITGIEKVIYLDENGTIVGGPTEFHDQVSTSDVTLFSTTLNTEGACPPEEETYCEEDPSKDDEVQACIDEGGDKEECIEKICNEPTPTPTPDETYCKEDPSKDDEVKACIEEGKSKEECISEICTSNPKTGVSVNPIVGAVIVLGLVGANVVIFKKKTN